MINRVGIGTWVAALLIAATAQTQAVPFVEFQSTTVSPIDGGTATIGTPAFQQQKIFTDPSAVFTSTVRAIDTDTSKTHIGSGTASLFELVVNDTGILWTDYHIEMTLPSGASAGDLAISAVSFDLTGVGGSDFTSLVDSSTITDFGQKLDLFFTPGNLADGGTLGLIITFDFDEGKVPVDSTFTLTQWPTFPSPEPSTLALLAAGISLMGFRAAKRRG